MTITSTSSLIRFGDMPPNPAAATHAAHLYTEAIDTLLSAPHTLHDVVSTSLLPICAISGVSVVSMLAVNDEEIREVFSVHEWRVVVSAMGETFDLSEGDGAPAKRREYRYANVEEIVRQAEENLATSIAQLQPDCHHLIIHWLVSEPAENAICMFRVATPTRSKPEFSANDRALIESLAPYLFRIFRLEIDYKARTSGYQFFAQRSAELARQFGLTPTEGQIFQRLVSGGSNAVIAKVMDISVATVKTHINHILQKAGCRNRNDLLGRYFSSLDALPL